MNRENRELIKTLKLPKIRHMGIVVQNIDRAINYYSDIFQIGPWFKTRFTGGENYLRGEEKINTEYETASAFLGKVEYQLIEVKRGDRDACLDHLEQHGEGLHHVGVYVNNTEVRLSAYNELGVDVLQTCSMKCGGRVGGTLAKYAYLDSASIGGIIFELIQIDFLGTTISSSRFWFELGSISGNLEKLKL